MKGINKHLEWHLVHLHLHCSSLGRSWSLYKNSLLYQCRSLLAFVLSSLTPLLVCSPYSSYMLTSHCLYLEYSMELHLGLDSKHRYSHSLLNLQGHRCFLPCLPLQFQVLPLFNKSLDSTHRIVFLFIEYTWLNPAVVFVFCFLYFSLKSLVIDLPLFFMLIE
jgi:hypothetical protein